MHSRLRFEIVNALVQIGDSRAVEPLLQVLTECDVNKWQRIIENLGNFRDPRLLRPLVDALRDKAGFSRQSAAYALGKLGDSGAIPALLDALNDVDDRVRFTFPTVPCEA